MHAHSVGAVLDCLAIDVGLVAINPSSSDDVSEYRSKSGLDDY